MAKIFKLNECDWVASNTIDEAIEWYLNLTGLPEDEALDLPCEIENLSKMVVTMEMHPSYEKEFAKYSELQKKYLKEGELTYKVPADELLEIEWEGKTYIFCSTEY